MTVFYCARCGKVRAGGQCWCDACHAEIVADIERRQAIQPGCGGQDIDPVTGMQVVADRLSVEQLESSVELSPGHLDDLISGLIAPCTECGRRLQVRGRIMGRPYCNACLSPSGSRNTGRSAPKDDLSPSQENAIRCLEDD